MNELRTLYTRLQSHTPNYISSPEHAPKRASVSIVIRITEDKSGNSNNNKLHSIEELLERIICISLPCLSWLDVVMDHAQVQVLFIERSKRPNDRWSGHIAFPGGKKEPGETDRDAAVRETLEEVGLRLDSDTFAYLGELDQQFVTARFGNQLLMVVCAFVYLQLSFSTPPLCLSADEVEQVHWVPLHYLLTAPRHNIVRLPLAPRIVPHRAPKWMFTMVDWLLGSTYWEGIPLPHSMAQLWGLTLAITDDMLKLCVEDGVHVLTRRGMHWPLFDKWEYNAWIKVLRWIMIRKHSTHMDRMAVIKWGAMLAVLTRLGFLFLLSKGLLRMLKWIMS